MKLTWKELRRRFKDGEPFLILDVDTEFEICFVRDDLLHYRVILNSEISGYMTYNNESIAVFTLLDYFETDTYFYTISYDYCNTEQFSNNSRCICNKCLEYDKLYNK